MKTEDLNEINQYLKKNKFISTNSAFSEQFLGKSSRYFSMLSASGRSIKADGVIHLAETLRSRAKLLKQHSGTHQAIIADTLTQYSNKALKSLTSLDF
jgi:hypothetical protein